MMILKKKTEKKREEQKRTTQNAKLASMQIVIFLMIFSSCTRCMMYYNFDCPLILVRQHYLVVR